MNPSAARRHRGGEGGARGRGARRWLRAGAAAAFALLGSRQAAAQLPVAKPLVIEPKSYGFTQLPVGGSTTIDFRVCKPVADSLHGATLIGQGLTGQIIQATSSGPFHIVAGKTIDLRTTDCQTVTIEFRPTSVGAFYAWLLFRVQESPFSPGNRKLFESYALITGGARRAEGIFFVDAAIAGGSGGISGPGMRCPDSCHGEFPAGAQVTFTAVPGSGQGAAIPYFRSWGGACAGPPTRTCTLTVTGDATISASFGNFSPPPRPAGGRLRVRITGNGDVLMHPGATCSGSNAVCPPVGGTVGTRVTLGAVGAVFFLPTIVQKPFLGWGGACAGAGDACTVELSGFETEVVANFGTGTTPLRRLLVVAVEGEGRVRASGLDCPGDCGERYSQSDVVSLAAEPAPGWTFGSWGWGRACAGKGNPCALTMSTSNVVTATFRPAIPWPGAPGAPSTAHLDVLVSTEGSASGSAIECPPTCSADLPIGAAAWLGAQPQSPYRFAGWSGACGGQGRVCQLPMTQDRRTTALFALPEFRLDVGTSGGGRVSVGAQPSLSGCCSHHRGVCGCGGSYVVCCDATFSPTCGCTQVNCPGDCTETYPAGSTVVLKAAANSGWRFAGWAGACAGQGSSCTLLMSADRTTTAVFSR